ncbi:hypothetical protein G2W53_001131 [Senna tora]|uniref:Uncharacterized protein n=1 Tax=Senna tora TaxID=362788 RepID=A0A835CIB8_9FABA|nr:hypothetical protein G2W53_001131 [Senna tora]
MISLDQKSLTQAHRYILFNCVDVQQYIREHEDIVNSHTGKRKWSKAKSHSNDFIQWFETRAMNDDISDFVKGLSRGPNTIAKKFSGYVIKGYRGHLDENRYYVMKTVPRDLFNMGDQSDGGQEFYWGDPSDSSSNPTLPTNDGEVDLVRMDVPATIIDQPLPTLDDQPHEKHYEEDSDFDALQKICTLVALKFVSLWHFKNHYCYFVILNKALRHAFEALYVKRWNKRRILSIYGALQAPKIVQVDLKFFSLHYFPALYKAGI